MSTFISAHLGDRYRASAPPPPLSAVQEDARRSTLASDKSEDWETVACLCGAEGGYVLTDVDRYGLPYRKVLCPDCGLLRVTPRWTVARYARFYQSQYRDLYSPLAGTDAASTLRRLAEAPGAGLVASFVKEAWWRFGDARLSRPVMIEIGAGGGWNLARLPREWKRIGYDVDERFLVAGRAAFGVELRRGFIDEALEKLHEADCVLLSHVLEHVPDPVTTLRTIAAAARPDALLLIEVPGIFRLHRTSLDPMRYWQNAHTYTFCAKTLVSTCRRAGLEPLQVDEWIRLVLRPSAVTSRAVANDAKMARSIAGYLHYCELSHRLRQACSRLPLGAAAATWLAGRSADAIMRIWIALGLVRGARAGRTGLTI